MDTMTLAEAKRQCKALIGRLPRCGHEVLIVTTPVTVPVGTCIQETWLRNTAGRYELYICNRADDAYALYQIRLDRGARY